MTDLPTAGRFEGREHRLPIRVYYEDTDFTGLVYHANYVRYFERGRSDCLRLMGVGHAELLDGDQPMVVRTTYEAVKGPRLIIAQIITRGDEVLCRAEVEAVCIHLDGRPRRPTRALVEKIGPWLTGEA